MSQFSFNSKFNNFKDKQDQPEVSPPRDDNNYSPRSSVVYIPEDEEVSNENLDLYKGFHADKRHGPNVPPLSHPIKPRFRKKGSSLLGKLIYSNRKDSESSNTSQATGDEEPNYDHSNDTRNTSVVSNRKSVGSSQSSGSSNRFKFRLSSHANELNHHQSSQEGIQTPLAPLAPSAPVGSDDTPQEPPLRTRPSGTNITNRIRHGLLKPDPNTKTYVAEDIKQSNEAPPPGYNSLKKYPTTFDLDFDLNDLNGIVKTPPVEASNEPDDGTPNSQTSGVSPLRKSHSSVGMMSGHNKFSSGSMAPGSINGTNGGNGYFGGNIGWKAPDSWDVKAEAFASPKDTSELNSSDSESSSGSSINSLSKVNSNSNPDSNNSESNLDPHLKSHSTSNANLVGMEDIKHANRSNWNHSSMSTAYSPGKEEIEDEIARLNLPVLYGSRNSSHVVSSSDKELKTKNHIIRVFHEDNTFATILHPLDTTTTDLLLNVQKKFFLESTQNYQITVYIGNYVKVLEPFERPLKIQMGLLMLSGYTETDNLRMIGSEDLSFICKFVVESLYLRNLTHEEETMLSKDYVNVDISGLNLKNIPIIFHQHTYEIESLNVADNPAIYIPLDFIQSCTYLTSIIFSRNGCSKFPSNFLEAKSLKYLDMEKNFLDDLPPRIGHLRNLKHLKLNSNQLTSLPRSFSKLVNLETLNLSSNYFNSYPDPISDLVNLRDLDLSYNDLNYLPKSLSRLTRLSKLNLCTNKLQKALPHFFADLVSLKRLDIRYNYINNVDVLGLLPKLEAVYASKNYISRFSDRMESFRLLHLDRNPITNLEFNNVLSKLTVLDLSKAKLTIIPPDFLDKISNVEKLVLDKNHLVNLPDTLGNLRKLNYLSIYGNNLQTLPDAIGQLSSLQYLDLHSNNLPSIPDSIWDLTSLTHLNVSSNMLTSFPKPPLSVAKRISSTANFKTLEPNPSGQKSDLYGSGEMHPIEEGDEDYRAVAKKARSHSNSASSLSGSTSATSSLADNLTLLTLSDNRLNYECFNSLSLLNQLKFLNLSYNDILEIPDGALRRMTRLNELYLSGNELSALPSDDFESIKSLNLLFLNNNKLVSLPAELSKLTNLQYLDVASNQLKYNISNWPYDWNWHWNKKLKYLNFSGNKRFEIKQSHTKNPETGEDFDSLLVLKNLKVLGLIDVTLTTSSVPDQNTEMRIRTTASELDNIGYGVSDSMGVRDYVSSRDIFIQKFRGNENEVLFASFDGKGGAANQGHRVSAICKSMMAESFADELDKLKSSETVEDAIRRTFLSLNKEVNGMLAAKNSNTFTTNSALRTEFADINMTEDGNAGCSVTLIYIKDKKLYTANIGDTESLLSRNNGDHVLLTTKHDPTKRSEFERIRASGGYVSGDGTLDGDLFVSRGAGFFNYLPHTHSGPDITSLDISTADEMIVMATKVFWDFIPYELTVDIIRLEKDDPMLAAQKLRDFAISYGASDKIAVMVISLGDQKLARQKFGSNALYNNLGRDNALFSNKKRRDRAQGAGDTTLRMLEDEIDPPVGELALVFTDIKNSTLLWDTYPVAMRSAIKTHNSIMRRQLRIVGGYEVKTEGDAFMVSFTSPTSALLWCFNVQQQLLTADWPVEILETDQCFEVTDNQGNIIYRGLSVRMGVHWGSPVCELDVVTRRMDYFGPMVNRASRISALADGGQIAISSDFFDEIKSLFNIHQQIVSGKHTISEAYLGNIMAGEIIEKEIGQLEETGCNYFEIGEKKLKGLEAPEHITLAYPKKLQIRFEIFQQQTKSSLDTSNIIFGALPIDSIYGMRTISLRLERVCCSLNGSSFMNDFQENSSEQLMKKSLTLFKEDELLGLMNHIVIRIENCVTVLHMRQQMSALYPDANGLLANVTTTKIMDELTGIIQEFKNLTQRT